MAAIGLKNVSKVYGTGEAQTVALKDVNFRALGGELALIMGPSGAGKSTFLTIAGGLRRPSAGSVLICARDIGKLNARSRQKLRLNSIGFILQAYNLVPYLTVKDQFRLVDKVKKEGNLTSNEFAGLTKRLGIETLMTKFPAQLSGGQQQRVAIARALYPDPDIILADEPTASLDSARVVEVGALLRSLAREHDKAIIVVTHDLRLEKYADRIWDMMDGHLKRRK